MIYLDHMATCPIAPEVLEAMDPWQRCANPAAGHLAGRQAAEAVAQARRQLAALIGCPADCLSFCSGATEASNAALRGATRPGDRVLVSAVEHHSVLEPAEALAEQGRIVEQIRVDARGCVDLCDLASKLPAKLVSVQLCNNEIGTAQPIREIAQVLATVSPRPLLHVDAAQGVGLIPFDPDAWGVDLASLSAHKMYGPKGIGALYVRGNCAWTPQQLGGQQELGRRAGTVAVPLAVGFGAAAALMAERGLALVQRLNFLAKLLECELAELQPHRRGAACCRHPGCVSLELDVDARRLVAAIGDDVACSAGAACSDPDDVSHVLRAIGLDDDRARRVVRLSPGAETSVEDIREAARVICRAGAWMR